MNKTVVFLLGLFLGVILVVVLCKTGNMSLDSKCKHDYSGELLPDQGREITRAEFISMKDSFQSNLASVRFKAGFGSTIDIGAWGGRIGKFALQKLINQLPKDSLFVNYYFGRTNAIVNPKTCVVFYSTGGPLNKSASALSLLFPEVYAGISSSVYIATTSYCPPRCPSVPTQ